MMNFNLLNIGFGNVVMGDKVVAMISPESAPIKKVKGPKQAVSTRFSILFDTADLP